MYNNNNEKVQWLREEQITEHLKVATSDRTGILSISIGGMKPIYLYADAIACLLAGAQAIREYAENNKDIVFTSEQSKEARKVKTQQTRNVAKAAMALQSIGLDADSINQLLQAQAKKLVG